MLKRILFAALWLPLLALAQSYPSPTFNNLTVQGTATLTSATISGSSSLGVTSVTSSSGITLGELVSPNITPFRFGDGSGWKLNFQTTSGTTFASLKDNGNFVANGGIDSTPVGATTPSSGAFTTLSASSTVSGTGFTSYFASPPAIGSTTASSGAFTTLSASSTVSGTGFSNYLASPPAIGGTTPSSGKFTTLQSTSAFTPSSTAGIVGTTTNDNANAGSVGEVVTATSTGTSLTSGVAANCVSVSLTAGDWDVTGVVEYVAAAGTTTSGYTTGVNTTSATYQTITGSFLNVQQTFGLSVGAGTASYQSAPLTRFSLASTTPVYLVGAASFASSTMTCNGFIRARRKR